MSIQVATPQNATAQVWQTRFVRWFSVAGKRLATACFYNCELRMRSWNGLAKTVGEVIGEYFALFRGLAQLPNGALATLAIYLF